MPRGRRLLAVVLASVLGVGGFASLGAARSATAAPSASWSFTRPTPAGTWATAAFGAGRWVVLGSGGVESTSTNGTRWDEVPDPSGSWGAVTFASGRFVALLASGAGPQEMTSTNGESWQTSAGPSSTSWSAVAYGGGRFIAASSLGVVAISSNGTNWSTTFSRRFDHFTGVAYGNGRYIVVDGLHGDSLESSDGVHWAFYPAAFAQQRWSSVAYGNGNFVATDGTGTGTVATTDLGYEWALRPVSPVQPLGDVSFGCNTFLAVGSPGTSANDVFTSPTGATWTATAVPTDPTGVWAASAFGGGHFVVVDRDGDIAWSRSNGPCGPTIPDPPQQVSGNIHTGEVWTYMHPPASDGGAVVTSYRVTITGNGLTKTCAAPVYFEPNCIIKGLKNHQVYNVAAQSRNKFGYSADTDPYFVIPVASWTFAVASPVPVVLHGSSFPVDVTGIQANSLGIYPVTTVTSEVGSTRLTCRPSPFGECLFSVLASHVGVVPLTGSYTGYGRTYRAATAHVWEASVTLGATSVSTSGRVTVTIAGGPPSSPVHLAVGARTAIGRLGAGGGGAITVIAPSTPGKYTLTVVVDGVALDRVTIAVHA